MNASQRERLERLSESWSSGDALAEECADRAARLLLEVAPLHRLLRVRAAGAIGDFDFAYEAIEELKHLASR